MVQRGRKPGGLRLVDLRSLRWPLHRGGHRREWLFAAAGRAHHRFIRRGHHRRGWEYELSQHLRWRRQRVLQLRGCAVHHRLVRCARQRPEPERQLALESLRGRLPRAGDERFRLREHRYRDRDRSAAHRSAHQQHAGELRRSLRRDRDGWCEWRHAALYLDLVARAGRRAGHAAGHGPLRRRVLGAHQ